MKHLLIASQRFTADRRAQSCCKKVFSIFLERGGLKPVIFGSAQRQILTGIALGAIGLVSCLGMGVALAASNIQPSEPDAIAQLDFSHSDSFIWPAQGTLTQGFLPRISHMGIDIAGALGTTVVAAAAGRVVYAGWDEFGLGNVIKIEHSGGLLSVYGHNQRLLVREGQWVERGQIIALMGSTGHSNGPHLHFEIRQGDADWVDPIAYLPPLIAGKIPPMPPVATAADPSTLNAVRVETANLAQQKIAEAACARETIIAGETPQFRVRVCRQEGQLFYFGQSKQDANSFVWLPARLLAGDRYRADNQSYSYYVSRDRVEVTRNGLPIRSERFRS